MPALQSIQFSPIFSELRSQGLSGNSTAGARSLLIILNTLSQALNVLEPEREGRDPDHNYVVRS